jgi:hypothetical protein
MRRSLLAPLALSVALSGCGGDASSAAADASSTGSACTSKTGTLHGKVSTSEMPSPGALLDLRQTPSDVPTHIKAHDDATYSVELEAGSWIVGGESADGYCSTSQPLDATIEPCGNLELDVLLDTCLL